MKTYKSLTTAKRACSSTDVVVRIGQIYIAVASAAAIEIIDPCSHTRLGYLPPTNPGK